MLWAEPGGCIGQGPAAIPLMGMARTVCWEDGGTGGGNPNLDLRWIPKGDLRYRGTIRNLGHEPLIRHHIHGLAPGSMSSIARSMSE
jgi:hypothetical protein